MAEKSKIVKRTSGCTLVVVELGCNSEIETGNIKVTWLAGAQRDGLMPSSPPYFHIILYLDDTVVAILSATRIRSGYYRCITYADDILVMHEYYTM